MSPLLPRVADLGGPGLIRHANRIVEGVLP